MTDKMFEARERYEEIRNGELFGTKPSYIYTISPLPVLICQEEGDTWRTVPKLPVELRVPKGGGFVKYKLEMVAVSFGGDRYFKFPVYMEFDINPRYYLPTVVNHFFKRINPIFIK